jgi:superfamily II helicase
MYIMPYDTDELDRLLKQRKLFDKARSLETAGGGMRQGDAQMKAEGRDPYSEENLFADMMRSDTKISWLLNWERVEENLYDKGTEQKRAEVCVGCGENRPSSNKAASLGIDIMGTGLCQKCANEGYLARF